MSTPGKDVYPWYSVVEAGTPLLQGDFINECPLVVPQLAGIEVTEKLEDVPVRIRLTDVIVLTQSCDLEQNNVESVLLCPIVTFSQVQEANPAYKKRVVKDGLKQGLVVGYHLMNKCTIPGFERDLVVVDFRSVYIMPLDFIRELAARQGPRLRLLPPYVEHLSQGFARHFMRVGLPVPIDLD